MQDVGLLRRRGAGGDGEDVEVGGGIGGGQGEEFVHQGRRGQAVRWGGGRVVIGEGGCVRRVRRAETGLMVRIIVARMCSVVVVVVVVVVGRRAEGYMVVVCQG